MLHETDPVEPVELTEFIEPDDSAATAAESEPAGQQAPPRTILLAPFRAVRSLVRSVYRLACLVLILAIVAAIPIANFVALGYLLDAQGRLGRSGRLRDAFPVIEAIGRIGAVLFGFWIWLLPLGLLASAAADARLIDRGSPSAIGLQLLLLAASLLVTVHLCLAVGRGGRLNCFFRPLKNLLWFLRRRREGNYWEDAGEHVREFVAGLNLKYYFGLGVRGFLGGFAWLLLPTALFAAANGSEGLPILLSVGGGLMLVPVLWLLPMQQAHFSAENRLRAIFEIRKVLPLFFRTPLTWMFAVLLTLLVSFPLHFAKVVLPPRDAMWLVTIFFVATIFPVKLFTGWAYHRAISRPALTCRGFRWFLRVLVLPGGVAVSMLPGLVIYTGLLFLTQDIGEHGKAVLFEHHAFLLPTPFGVFNW